MLFLIFDVSSIFFQHYLLFLSGFNLIFKLLKLFSFRFCQRRIGIFQWRFSISHFTFLFFRSSSLLAIIKTISTVLCRIFQSWFTNFHSIRCSKIDFFNFIKFNCTNLFQNESSLFDFNFVWELRGEFLRWNSSRLLIIPWCLSIIYTIESFFDKKLPSNKQSFLILFIYFHGENNNCKKLSAVSSCQLTTSHHWRKMWILFIVKSLRDIWYIFEKVYHIFS